MRKVVCLVTDNKNQLVRDSKNQYVIKQEGLRLSLKKIIWVYVSVAEQWDSYPNNEKQCF